MVTGSLPKELLRLVGQGSCQPSSGAEFVMLVGNRKPSPFRIIQKKSEIFKVACYSSHPPMLKYGHVQEQIKKTHCSKRRHAPTLKSGRPTNTMRLFLNNIEGRGSLYKCSLMNKSCLEQFGLVDVSLQQQRRLSLIPGSMQAPADPVSDSCSPHVS